MSPVKWYLFKRKNGVWYVGYLQDGRKRWKSARTSLKVEALRKIANSPELFFAPPPVPKSLASFTDEYLRHAAASFRPNTVEIYRWALSYLKSFLGNPSLLSLTMRDFDNFAAFLLENHAPASVNMYLRGVKSAMSVAVRWKLLPSNPFAGGKSIRVPQTLPTYFTKPKLEKLLSLIRQNWLKELVIFSVNTGLRQGEVLNLTWDNVDLSRRLIHVELAKGGKRRTVPMNDVVAALLQTKASRGAVGPVFTLRGKPVEKFTLSHMFKAYVRDAKLPDNLRWHSLRHTHATYLVQAGVPIFSVAKLLGHSDVKVTERHYAALSPENLHDDVNRVLVGTN